MNRIILIGNGFDLAHGLPTSYKDFIDWYLKLKLAKFKSNSYIDEEDNLCRISRSKRFDIINKTNPHVVTVPLGTTQRFSVKNFFDVNENVDIHMFSLFREIMNGFEQNGWVDIEFGYYKLLKSYIKDGKDQIYIKAVNKQLQYIQTLLIDYLNKVCSNQVEINPDIKEIIYQGINRGDISIGGSLSDSNFVKRIMLLNFNYTTIADKYAGGNTIVNHIHGCINNKDYIIFGYGDELDDDFKTILNANDNEYLVNVKSVRYMESDKYRKFLQFIESEPYQVYVMGHSCGNSDRTLLNTLFEHKNCISIKPFYYRKPDGADNYMEIVQNIYRNFTDPKAMRDKVVNKTLCEPLPQSKQTL